MPRSPYSFSELSTDPEFRAFISEIVSTTLNSTATSILDVQTANALQNRSKYRQKK